MKYFLNVAFIIGILFIARVNAHFLLEDKKEEEYPRRENILRLYPRFKPKERDENKMKEIEKKLSEYFEEKKNTF